MKARTTSSKKKAKEGNTLRIAIGVDHRAYRLKEFLIKQKTIGSTITTWLDLGTYTTERTDYPIYVKKLVSALKNQQADLGILSCGSGIGMVVAANRYPDIYAGLVWNERITQSAKEHDNINVLVIPADFVSQQEAKRIIATWLSTEFLSGRYAERLAMIDDISHDQ